MLSQHVRSIALMVFSMLLAPAALAQSCSNGLSMREVRAMAESSGPAISPHPAIARLVARIGNSYACKGAVNHYATQPDTIIESAQRDASDALIVEFTNKAAAGRNICGSIRYGKPVGLPGGSAAESFVASANAVIINFEVKVADEVAGMLQPIFQAGRNYPAPNAKFLTSIARDIQAGIAASFRELVATQGWNDAQVRQFVQASRCVSLPSVSGPDSGLLAKYASAFADYRRVEPIIGSMTR